MAKLLAKMKAHHPADEAFTNLVESGNLFSELFKDDSISVEIYKPEQEDLQAPHDRDELYVIISGSGTFRLKDEAVRFKAGDLLLVPQGEVHRFEDFTEDFATWVIFYGTPHAEADE